MVYVFLADGFEETEAFVPIDLMSRAGIKVTTVGVGSTTLTGAHGITVRADISEELFLPDEGIEAIMLPGGPGTPNLARSETVKRAIHLASDEEITVAAICAAPTVLANESMLGRKTATCFPSCSSALGDSYRNESVIYDRPFLTARAAGSAFEFGLKLVEIIKGEKAAQDVAAEIYYKKRLITGGFADEG